jgi:hypothetical protein
LPPACYCACRESPPTEEATHEANCLPRREGMQNRIVSLLECIRRREAGPAVHGRRRRRRRPGRRRLRAPATAREKKGGDLRAGRDGGAPAVMSAAASSNRGPVHRHASTPPFPPIESTSTNGRVGRPWGTSVQLASADEHEDRKGEEEDAPGDPPRSRSSSTSRCGRPRGLPRSLRRSPPPLRPVPDL